MIVWGSSFELDAFGSWMMCGFPPVNVVAIVKVELQLQAGVVLRTDVGTKQATIGTDSFPCPSFI